MKLSLIAAMDEKRGIGKDNKLPGWKAPGDLKRFKALTTGKVVVMGRKTFESIRAMTPPEKEVLPDRVKIVISTTMEPSGDKLIVVDSLEFAIHFAKAMIQKFSMPEEIMVIGGGQVYLAALPFATTLHLTMVKGEFESDTFFPDFQSSGRWTLGATEDFETHSFHTYDVAVPVVEEPVK
jgi:dihydrofolate reductase